MKKTRMGLGLLILSLAYPGTSDLFMHDLQVIADAYYDLGSDNNYLEMELVDSDKFLAREHIQAMSLEFEGLEDLTNSIKECVFMSKGAYGIHMTDELQDRVATKYAEYIYFGRKGQSGSLNVFQVADDRINMNTGIFWPGCVFGVEYEGMVLLMQSGAMD